MTLSLPSEGSFLMLSMRVQTQKMKVGMAITNKIKIGSNVTKSAPPSEEA